jgi:hypothetical protein
MASLASGSIFFRAVAAICRIWGFVFFSASARGPDGVPGPRAHAPQGLNGVPPDLRVGVHDPLQQRRPGPGAADNKNQGLHGHSLIRSSNNRVQNVFLVGAGATDEADEQKHRRWGPVGSSLILRLPFQTNLALRQGPSPI